MSYQFSYELRPDTIYATIYGEKQTGELIGPYIYKIMQQCFRLGRTRIAIERHVSAQISERDLVSLVRELSRADYGNLQIAYIDERFCEQTPADLGIDIRDSSFISPRIFSGRLEAQRWLEPAPQPAMTSAWAAAAAEAEHRQTTPTTVLDYSSGADLTS